MFKHGGPTRSVYRCFCIVDFLQAHSSAQKLEVHYWKCCAKLDSSTTLVAALPCRLDISSDNFNCLASIILCAAITLQSAVRKVIQNPASFCSLYHADLTYLKKIWRILSLVACAIRVGGTKRDDKEMTYWILRNPAELLLTTTPATTSPTTRTTLPLLPFPPLLPFFDHSSSHYHSTTLPLLPLSLPFLPPPLPTILTITTTTPTPTTPRTTTPDCDHLYHCWHSYQYHFYHYRHHAYHYHYQFLDHHSYNYYSYHYY